MIVHCRCFDLEVWSRRRWFVARRIVVVVVAAVVDDGDVDYGD